MHRAQLHHPLAPNLQMPLDYILHGQACRASILLWIPDSHRVAPPSGIDGRPDTLNSSGSCDSGKLCCDVEDRRHVTGTCRYRGVHATSNRPIPARTMRAPCLPCPPLQRTNRVTATGIAGPDPPPSTMNTKRMRSETARRARLIERLFWQVLCPAAPNGRLHASRRAAKQAVLCADKPKAPFKPVFEVATTREGSDVVLVHDPEGEPRIAYQLPPHGHGLEGGAGPTEPPYRLRFILRRR